jgi:hypothetical protein
VVIGKNLLKLFWAHERTPIANFVGWSDKPVALSIVQARLTGLVHFGAGYIFTYAPFLIASTVAKSAHSESPIDALLSSIPVEIL